MSPFVLARAPQLASKRSVTRVMGLVLLALLPAALAQVWLLGAGFGFQILLAVAFGLGFEALMLKLRGRPMRPFLTDLSAPLTAVLLALLLPPLTPWWMLCLGLFAALVLAKHLYGGLGDNLFNPAMVGYAVLLIGFPSHFSQAGGDGPWFAGNPGWIAFLYALGGVCLLWKKIIPWHTPLAMLGGAAVAELGFRFAGAQAPAFALQELFSGTLLLAAFFIVTDPVTGCLSPRGRIFFGAGAGLLTVLLTRWASTPDGLPFAVLLMNCAAPWLDGHTRPARHGPEPQP